MACPQGKSCGDWRDENISSRHTGQLFLYLSLKHWWVSNTLTDIHMQHSLQWRNASLPPTLQKPHWLQWNGFFPCRGSQGEESYNKQRIDWISLPSEHKSWRRTQHRHCVAGVTRQGLRNQRTRDIHKLHKLQWYSAKIVWQLMHWFL